MSCLILTISRYFHHSICFLVHTWFKMEMENVYRRINDFVGNDWKKLSSCKEFYQQLTDEKEKMESEVRFYSIISQFCFYTIIFYLAVPSSFWNTVKNWRGNSPNWRCAVRYSKLPRRITELFESLRNRWFGEFLRKTEYFCCQKNRIQQMFELFKSCEIRRKYEVH